MLYNKAIKSFVVANYNFFEMSDLSIVIYLKNLRIFKELAYCNIYKIYNFGGHVCYLN